MWQLALKGKLKKHKMGMETEVLITNPLYKCSYLLGYSSKEGYTRESEL